METVARLASQLPPDAKLWGIPRNGTIISGLLAHQRDDLRLHPFEPQGMLSGDPKTIVIIDDIYDTGRTLKPYMEQGFQVATLFYRNHVPRETTDRPHFWASCVKTEHWLVFPWEKK